MAETNLSKEDEKKIITELENRIEKLLSDVNYENLAEVMSFIKTNIDIELIVAIKGGGSGLQLAPVKTGDGKRFFAMFTSFDEQMKGPSKVQSTYEVSFKSIFDFVLKNDEIDGVIINPWGHAFRMEKPIIQVIAG